MSAPPLKEKPARCETSGSEEASKSTVEHESTGVKITLRVGDYLDIADIKDQVTIFSLAAALHPDWNPRSGFSPLRPDRKPGSFSIYDNGKRWKDFATGEGGDVIDFIRKARGCKPGEAIRELRDMISGNRVPQVAVTHYRGDSGYIGAPHVPHLRKPSATELRALSETRSIAVEPLRIAVERDFLWSTSLRDNGNDSVSAWVVTDSVRKVFSARRYDGKGWKRLHGAKAYTLAGGKMSWSIGLLEAAKFGSIALCEGAPDFLSAFAHAWASGLEGSIAPVCMLCATACIPDDALPHFSGKSVRIFVHDDDAGESATHTWAKQLTGIAASVDGFGFGGALQANGEPVKDLNDLLRIDCDEWDGKRQLVESVMDFGKVGER